MLCKTILGYGDERIANFFLGYGPSSEFNAATVIEVEVPKELLERHRNALKEYNEVQKLLAEEYKRAKETRRLRRGE